MRNRRDGFTLIELLLVIAIIGILAAVMVPRLLSARLEANERAAQMYSSNVAVGLTAVLASDPDLQPTEVVAGTYNCDAGAAQTTQVVVAGTVYGYGWGPAPGSVQSCSIVGNDVDGSVTVTIDTVNYSYVNGVRQ